jgi:TonB family protein
VKVQALVDTFGTVTDTRVVRSIPLLDQAAVTAVRQSRWQAAHTKGRPVAVWVEVPVRFIAPQR